MICHREVVAKTAELIRIRRLPATDRCGALVGIVAADDLLSPLSDEMSALATMVSRKHKREAEIRKNIG